MANDAAADYVRYVSRWPTFAPWARDRDFLVEYERVEQYIAGVYAHKLGLICEEPLRVFCGSRRVSRRLGAVALRDDQALRHETVPLR